MNETEIALLRALDAHEWRLVNAHLGAFYPSMADALVRLGLVEKRSRPKKPGSFEYRRTSKGSAALVSAER
jgi:hypothetical protein